MHGDLIPLFLGECGFPLREVLEEAGLQLGEPHFKPEFLPSKTVRNEPIMLGLGGRHDLDLRFILVVEKGEQLVVFALQDGMNLWSGIWVVAA